MFVYLEKGGLSEIESIKYKHSALFRLTSSNKRQKSASLFFCCWWCCCSFKIQNVTIMTFRELMPSGIGSMIKIRQQ